MVSPDKPERDLVAKRGDYAEAGIPDYWIVTPQTTTITVLTLAGDVYREHGGCQYRARNSLRGSVLPIARAPAAWRT